MNSRSSMAIVAAAFLAVASCSDDSTPEVSASGIYPERVAEYIQDSPKTRLRVDVDCVQEHVLNDEVQTLFLEHITPLLDKPDGVTLDIDDIMVSDPGRGWTFDELISLSEKFYDAPRAADEAVVHVMVVDGYYAESSTGGTLGVSWGNRHIVLFAETLANACAPDLNEELRRRGLVERACNATLAGTMIHEFGHVIGLVNNGLEMVEVHNDPDHPTHDADPNSIMFWQFDVVGIFDEVKGKVLDEADPLPPFSPECLADINAIK